MKTLRAAFLILAITGIVTGVWFPLSALATANCYDYVPSCDTNLNCGFYVSPPYTYCKQLCIPLIDPGCCQYIREGHRYFTAGGGGTCPCSGQTAYRITVIKHDPLATCVKANGGGNGGCQEDVLGTCSTP